MSNLKFETQVATRTDVHSDDDSVTEKRFKNPQTQKEEKIICSCGQTRCPLVTTFGLPVSVWTPEIKPIALQFERDQKALEIRKTRGAAVGAKVADESELDKGWWNE